ncbi:shikimate kinase [uncultured Martelella sp.]|uniref:shikimate kinase n=1 Tax=uncultured Martelella sp. TaxID=392331 RepID=UPI0029C946AB|nr:shikimate kinase [uncultured Martelella sp.]
MQKAVILLDGPIGVGKSTLGRAAAASLGYGFIDGDDLSAPGYLRSILQTNRGIARAAQDKLQSQTAVIVSYPIRCTNWIFFQKTFARAGIECHCIGLIADMAHIAARQRVLSSDEIARSREMIDQGYGQRAFSDFIVRTDEAGFDETCAQLTMKIQQALRRR